MKSIRSKALLVAPLMISASLMITSCNSGDSQKTETTTTSVTTTPQEAQVKPQDTVPLDSTAVTKPEEKLNGPSK